MGRSYDVPEDVDEADLMAELDALEEDLATEGPSTAGGVPSYLQVSRRGRAGAGCGGGGGGAGSVGGAGGRSWGGRGRWLVGGAGASSWLQAGRCWRLLGARARALMPCLRAARSQEPDLDLPNAPQQPLEEDLGLPALAQRT
jgi:hypothetical protein